jgi:hypothetical protein
MASSMLCRPNEHMRPLRQRILLTQQCHVEMSAVEYDFATGGPRIAAGTKILQF